MEVSYLSEQDFLKATNSPLRRGDPSLAIHFSLTGQLGTDLVGSFSIPLRKILDSKGAGIVCSQCPEHPRGKIAARPLFKIAGTNYYLSPRVGFIEADRFTNITTIGWDLCEVHETAGGEKNLMRKAVCANLLVSFYNQTGTEHDQEFYTQAKNFFGIIDGPTLAAALVPQAGGQIAPATQQEKARALVYLLELLHEGGLIDERTKAEAIAAECGVLAGKAQAVASTEARPELAV